MNNLIDNKLIAFSIIFLAFLTISCQQQSNNNNASSTQTSENQIKMAETKESQASKSPSDALALLKSGNERFIKKENKSYDYVAQVKATSKGQYPHSTVLSCIDSRIPTEIIFDQGIGDIFNARIAGNFVNDDILGSMEFACKVAGSKLIVVLGHTSCGAVKGACDNVELGNLTQMLTKIKPAIDGVGTEEGVARNSSNIEFVNEVAKKNVNLTIEDIREGSEILKEMHDNGEIDIIGAMYDVASGKVEFF